MEIWAFAVLFAAGVAAIIRHAGILGQSASRLRGPESGRFERFWSRRDGRLLAVIWLALFATAWLAPLGATFDMDPRGAASDLHPIRYAVLVGVQAVAAVLLVPLTAGLYLYKRAIPQIARDEADERERAVQGDVYRRTHALIIAGLALSGVLLALIPQAGRYILLFGSDHSIQWVDVLLPAWVLLFMLPSIAYAWMYPHRDDSADLPIQGAYR